MDGRVVDARAKSILFWNHPMMGLSHIEVIHIVESTLLSTTPNNFLRGNILDKGKIKVH